jgi:hypothetical protein
MDHAIGIDLLKAKIMFPAIARDLESLDGLLLIGMDHMDDAPKEQERALKSY